MSSDEVLVCKNCGAASPPGIKRCTCDKPTDSASPLPPAGHQGSSRFQLSVSETLHATTIVAVCFAMAQVSILLTILSFAVAIVAAVRTGVLIDESWRHGKPIQAGETMRAFWQSVAVVMGAFLAFIMISVFTFTVGSLLAIPAFHLPWYLFAALIGMFLFLPHVVALIYFFREEGFGIAFIYGLCSGLGFTLILPVMDIVGLLHLPSFAPAVFLPHFLAICCTIGFACFRDGLEKSMIYYTAFSTGSLSLAVFLTFGTDQFPRTSLLIPGGFFLLPVLLTLSLLFEQWRVSPKRESYRSQFRLD